MSSQLTDMNQKLHALAQNIACALGFEWKYSDKQPSHRALLDGPDGMGLNVSWKGFDHNRLEIYGRWPKPIKHRDMRVYQFYPQERPIISVAANRAPDSIAKDIGRRFLPEYLVLWQETVERKRAKVAELEKLDEMLARLVEIPGAQEDKYKDGVRFGKYDVAHGDAEVHSDGTVSVKIHNLPFKIACEVLERLEELNE